MTLVWLALVATLVVGVGTYLARASFILALADRQLPESLRLALQFVAPAVLAALVVSLLFGAEGNGPGWPQLLALGAGGVIGWKTRSLVAVLGTGMVVLWLATWVM